MDKAQISQWLRQLTTADGLSGAEDQVRTLAQELAQSCGATVRIDALGNVIAHKPATHGPAQGGPTVGRIMLAAHMDEIGLIVTRVEGSFLHVHRVGGVDPRSALAQEVTVYPTGPGAEKYPQGIPGYIGSRPPHVLSESEREKVVPLADLRVDVGSPSLTASVRVGDRIAIRGPYTELLNGRVASKALDNRASVAAVWGALGYLAGMQHTWDVFAVATVQEEIGLRGAITSAYGVAPDVAIAVDVTFAEQPGVDDTETVEADKGAAIAWGPNMHPAVAKRLRETAEAIELSYVTEIAPGASGTDAWAIQVAREGIPTGLTSIPLRYMHTAIETVVVADIDRTARLLAAFISRLDGQFLASLPEDV
jgi:tetrahedral aminopeptidase